MAWFAFDIAAYESDTAHLSTVEHGAYFLLIKYYMRTRMPPFDDDRALANIVQMPLTEWAQIAGTIRKFFKKRGTRLHQLKCDRTLDSEDMRATTRSEQARKAAEKRHSKTKLLVAASMPPARPVSAPALKTDADAMLNDATRPVQTSSVKEPETKVSGSAPKPDEVSHGKRKRRKPQFPIPTDWQLGERDRAFAAERGFDDAWCERNHEKFLAHHTARGTLTTDPSANWRTWVLNGNDFAPRGQRAGSQRRNATGTAIREGVAEAGMAYGVVASASDPVDGARVEPGNPPDNRRAQPSQSAGNHGLADRDDGALGSAGAGELEAPVETLHRSAGGISDLGLGDCVAAHAAERDVLSEAGGYPQGNSEPLSCDEA